MVVFRLTQDEYQTLTAASAAAGARNLSDYTRTELMALLRSDSLGGLVQRQLSGLSEKIVCLEDAVSQLAEEIASAMPDRNHDR